MSERYTKIFSISDNLYLDGAPLLIEAGALLKDNKNGKVLAQLKMRNLYHSLLSACKVHIRAFDPSGAELEGVEEFSYLDLQEVYGAEFGQKTAIPMPDKTTRRIKVSVIQAVFQDGAVWKHPAAEWTALEISPVRLADRITDDELRKQYSIEVGGKTPYYPEMVGNLFVCACGAVNRAWETTCYNCHRDFKTLTAALDENILRRKMTERLAQEEAERIEAEKAKKLELERQAEEQRIAKKRRKIGLIIGGIAAISITIVILITQVIIPANRYKEAEKLLAKEDYDGAAAAFEALGDYKDATKRKENAIRQKESQATYDQAEKFLAAGDLGSAAISFYKAGDYEDAHDRSMELWSEIGTQSVVSLGFNHTVGLRENGTVVATGDNSVGSCNVSDWTDIVDMDAGFIWTVGLRKDGAVVATGSLYGGVYNVFDWTDIVAVDSGTWHTVGLCRDGTVVAAGDNDYGQCDVSDWTDIVAVETEGRYTVGLRRDGTVVATGYNKDGQCDVTGWTDIVAVKTGGCTVGLRRNGTVVATGNNEYGQCNVSDWTDNVAVSAGSFHTVGLRGDGTVVATGDNEYGECNVSDWTDIIAVYAGRYYTVGLCADGTVVATGDNRAGQCNVSDWTDIKMPYE